MASATPSPEQLAAATLEHYRQHAERYRTGTQDHDVSQNIAALLAAITGPAPFTVLDFGCGPGRDLATLRRLGHRAIGLDGAAPFVAMARAATGCDVWLQDFLRLDLPVRHFDGIYANATLFHVPRPALPRVLGELRRALKPDGVLFSSNPRGDDQEGGSDARYGAYYRLETWQSYLSAAGFAEVTHYYRPAGRPCAEQPWLASVWRRVATG